MSWGYTPSTFVYPVQTPKQRENEEDPRVQVSEMLQGPKRLKGELPQKKKIGSCKNIVSALMKQQKKLVLH